MHKTSLYPKFSIITVTFNAEKTLEDTIKCVIAQTYKNIEYIIVDGASKDHTPEIIEKYKKYIHHLVIEPDHGLYDAMNKGIKLATGDYLCFLNAGDKFHKENTLELMVNSISDLNELPDVLYGETAIVDDKGLFLRMRRLTIPNKLNWKSFKLGMRVCHQAFFAKRNLAICELYDLKYRFSSDFDWCIRIMKRAQSLFNTRLILINYLNEGMSTRNHKASLKERFLIMSKHYGWTSTLLHHLYFVIRLAFKK